MLTSPLPEGHFDLIFYHPPYWDIVRYSDSPKDLSTCRTLEDFECKLNRSIERLHKVVRSGGVLAVLIGDKRKEGNYYALLRTLLSNSNIGQLKAIIIKVQHNCSSDRVFYGSRNPFMIPIMIATIRLTMASLSHIDRRFGFLMNISPKLNN